MPLQPNIILGGQTQQPQGGLNVAQLFALKRMQEESQDSAQERQLRGIKIQELQREQRSRDIFEQELRDPANYQPDGTIDATKVGDRLRQQDVGAWRQWTDLNTKNAENALKLRTELNNLDKSEFDLTEQRRQAKIAQGEYLGRLAYNGLQILDQNPTDSLHARDTTLATVATAAKDGAIDPNTAHEFLNRVAPASPSQMRQVFEGFIPPEMRAKLDKEAADTSKSKAEAEKATAEAANLRQYGRTTAPEAQKAEFVLDGKPVVGSFIPSPTGGRYFYLGKDVSDRAQHIPPASVLYPQSSQPIPEIKPGSKEFGIAQDLAYGKLSMTDFQRLYGRAAKDANLRTGIYDKARELNPNFNPSAFEMGFRLASNPKVQQQLAAQDNAMRMLPHLLEVSDAASRTGIPILNDYLIKGGSFLMGNKRYSNLQLARVAYADELAGALGFGSATDMNRQMGFDMTRTDLSPDAFRDGMQNIVLPFLQAKRDTLLKQMGVYGGSDFNPAAPKGQGAVYGTWNPKTGKLEK